MIQIQRILCPIDLSDGSRRALDHAIAIARWYGSTVTVVHVFSPVMVPAWGPGTPALTPMVLTNVDRDQLLADVKRFAGPDVPGIGTDVILREGNPAAEILTQADAMKADLLVLGTHGRSGVERFVLGSVAEKVLRRSRHPVLTVPPHSPDAVPATPGLFKRILCPVDFSDSSVRALNFALSIAQEADGRLTVLHVVSHEFEHADVTSLFVPDQRLTIAEYRLQREKEIRERLDTAVPKEAEAYCTAETLLISGKPWREILRVASEREADLIVMGVQGRGAADLALFGSTTQHVVREATCPVLTLRP